MYFGNFNYPGILPKVPVNGNINEKLLLHPVYMNEGKVEILGNCGCEPSAHLGKLPVSDVG